MSIVTEAIEEAEMLAGMLAELRQKVRELTHDCEAQLKTIHSLTAEIDWLKLNAQAQDIANRRTAAERDFWRLQCDNAVSTWAADQMKGKPEASHD